MSLPCKICRSATREVFTKEILRRHTGRFHRCDACGFLQLFEHPWLEEAYADGRESLDTGLLSRNISNAARVAGLLDLIPTARNPSYLDFGGGYGILVRLMRDKGYDFSLYDPFGKGLFVPGLCEPVVERKTGGGDARYGLITAFEVMEHVPDPMATFSLLFSQGRNILFSTELQPTGGQELSDWWYLSPETGQHLSFFTKGSLSHIASCIGARYVSDGKGLHLFSEGRVDPFLFRLFTNTRLASIRWALRRGKGSLTEADRQAVMDRTMQAYTAT
jgi:hypothetical protein